MLNLFDILGPTARDPAITAAVSVLAGNDETERGAIFTRPDVVTAILDLSGCSAAQPLHHRRLLEPSFGGGESLLAAADRLLTAYRNAGRRLADAGHEQVDAIRAVELHRNSFETTSAHLRAPDRTRRDADRCRRAMQPLAAVRLLSAVRPSRRVRLRRR